MGRIYLTQNVYEAALERIERIFKEFPVVIASVSGGKDSTVIVELALEVARRLRRLPLKVFWLDQEVEWDCVADHVRSIMNRDEVEPLWFQVPFRIPDSTTTTGDQFLHCWEPGAKWMRDKEPNSYHENVTGEIDWEKMFAGITRTYLSKTPAAFLGGVRCEESPMRLAALTAAATYQDITWGKRLDVKLGHYTFYPIYDWKLQDVWHAIHANGWDYCKLYDYMYRFGVKVASMRVSNVNHETALDKLPFMAEIEPDTWNRICERLPGVNAVNQHICLYQLPRKLPPMFETWREYRDHLLENLITVDEDREFFRGRFKAMEASYPSPDMEVKLMKYCISTLMVNDKCGTKEGQFQVLNWKSHINRTKEKETGHAIKRKYAE